MLLTTTKIRTTSQCSTTRTPISKTASKTKTTPMHLVHQRIESRKFKCLRTLPKLKRLQLKKCHHHDWHVSLKSSLPLSIDVRRIRSTRDRRRARSKNSSDSLEDRTVDWLRRRQERRNRSSSSKRQSWRKRSSNLLLSRSISCTWALNSNRID